MSDKYTCDWQGDYPVTIWRGNHPFIQADSIHDGRSDLRFLDMTDADIEFLLQALNAHEELVAACRTLLMGVDDYWAERHPGSIASVRDTLAKAEGKP